ncbi:hypothetical protein [Flavobacterium branchiophilum]|nr:hypothetical protein [Flavobacterium branchiophilum]
MEKHYYKMQKKLKVQISKYNILVILDIFIEKGLIKNIEHIYLFIYGINHCLINNNIENDFVDCYSSFESYIRTKFPACNNYSIPYFLSLIDSNSIEFFKSLYSDFLSENENIKYDFINDNVLEKRFNNEDFYIKHLITLLDRATFFDINTFDDFFIYLQGYFYVSKEDHVYFILSEFMSKYKSEKFKEDQYIRMACSNSIISFKNMFMPFLEDKFKVPPAPARIPSREK